MFQRFDNIKLAFFVDEECGGVGSSKANLEFFNDCCFVIQPDRNHAKNDYINYTNGIPVTSDEFDKAMHPILDRYMYSEAFGTFTDIGVLKENGLGICAFNIACGYLFAHSSDEVVHIPSLELCMDVVYETISTLSYKRWEHVSESKYKSGWDFDWEKYYDNYAQDELFDDDAYMDEALNTCTKKWCDKKNFTVDLDGSIYCNGCNDYIKEPNDIYGKLDTGLI